MEADRKWWNIAPTRRPRLKAMVFVVDGVVTRIRGVNPVETWNKDDDRGFADLTLTKPLKDNAEVDKLLPSLPMRLGDHRPHVRGKIREYLKRRVQETP